MQQPVRVPESFEDSPGFEVQSTGRQSPLVCVSEGVQFVTEDELISQSVPSDNLQVRAEQVIADLADKNISDSGGDHRLQRVYHQQRFIEFLESTFSVIFQPALAQFVVRAGFA